MVNREGPAAEVFRGMRQAILIQPLLIAKEVRSVVLGALEPGKIAVAPLELVVGQFQPASILQKKCTGHGHGPAPIYTRLTMNEHGFMTISAQNGQQSTQFHGTERRSRVNRIIEVQDVMAAGNSTLLQIPIGLRAGAAQIDDCLEMKSLNVIFQSHRIELSAAVNPSRHDLMKIGAKMDKRGDDQAKNYPRDGKPDPGSLPSGMGTIVRSPAECRHLGKL